MLPLAAEQAVKGWQVFYGGFLVRCRICVKSLICQINNSQLAAEQSVKRYRITKFDRMLGSSPNGKLNLCNVIIFMMNTESNADFIVTL